MTAWLMDTPLLQHGHPQVRLQAVKLTQLERTEADKALACWRFVQSLSNIQGTRCGHVSSLEVLRVRGGDAAGRSTLLIALLRSLEIPARLRPDALRPCGALRVEALIGGCWIPIDTFDEPAHSNASWWARASSLLR